MTYKFGFIGCGNMGGTLLAAAAEKDAGVKIAAADSFREKAELYAEKYANITAVSTCRAAGESEYLVIGVKPQMLEAMFDEIKETLISRHDGLVLISMAAGTKISDIERMATVEKLPVIRIMPNTAAAVGKGVILYCRNQYVTDEQLSVFTQAFSAAGLLDSIDESKIDAASALSGCGPAFAYMFMEALADGAVECGLPRDKALTYAAATLSGAAELLLSSGRHPGELKDAVCSPAGTTIAGVHALERSAFRAAAMDAVTAAFRRTAELSKK